MISSKTLVVGTSAIARSTLLGTEAEARIISTTTSGSITILSDPPASVDTEALTEDDVVEVFKERPDFTLPSGITVDFAPSAPTGCPCSSPTRRSRIKARSPRTSPTDAGRGGPRRGRPRPEGPHVG